MMKYCWECGCEKDDEDFPPQRRKCYECKAKKEQERYYANREIRLIAIRRRYQERKIPCPVCGDLMQPYSLHCRPCSNVLRYY